MERNLAHHRAGEASGPQARSITWEQRLGFPLRVVGQSNAPAFPQVVGNWWLEPLSPKTDLPVRARYRLEAVLAAGIQLKEVVVFHELPRAERYSETVVTMDDTPPSQEAKPGSMQVILHWLKVAGQRHVSRLNQAAHETNAAIRRAQERQASKPKRRDPCLVAVTEDGYWLEIDRWYN